MLSSDRWRPFFRDTMDSVKQSAALCLLRLYRTSPDLVPMGDWTSRVVHLLNDQHLVNASGRESTLAHRVASVGTATGTAAQCGFLCPWSLCTLPGGRSQTRSLAPPAASQASVLAGLLQTSHTDQQDGVASRDGPPCGGPVCASCKAGMGASCGPTYTLVCTAICEPGPTVLAVFWTEIGRCRVSTREGAHGVVTLGRIGAGAGQRPCPA